VVGVFQFSAFFSTTTVQAYCDAAGTGTGRRILPSARVQTLEPNVRPGSWPEARQAVLDNWYLHNLKAQAPALLELWEPRLGIQAEGWGIKQMVTKRGSSST